MTEDELRKAIVRKLGYQQDGNGNLIDYNDNTPREQVDALLSLYRDNKDLTDTLDYHLRKHLPHDGRYRHIEFEIAVYPDNRVHTKQPDLSNPQSKEITE